MKYAELQVTSNFTFMRGASHPEDLVETAAKLGYTKIAITDCNSVAGVVRAHQAAKEHNIDFIPACRLDLLDGPDLLAYPTDIAAWGRLCALLSKGNLRTEKGKCELYRRDMYEHAEGIKFIIIPPVALNSRFDFEDDFKTALAEYRTVFGAALYLAVTRTYTGDDNKRFFRLSQLGVPMVATNDVHYHIAAQRELQDVQTCVREKCTIQNAGFKLHVNAGRYLKPLDELERLYRQYPEALERTMEIAGACNFSLDTLKYLEPEWKSPDGRTADEHLRELTIAGAEKMFKGKDMEKVMEQIEFELAFFARRKLAPYFLRIYEYTQKAKN